MSLDSPNKDNVVKVLLASGKRLLLEALVIHEGYALHQPVLDGRQREGSWTVTHVVSGIAVWTTRREEDARSLMAWLTSAHPLPTTETALLLWRESPEAAPARAKFQEDAQRIAPRAQPFQL